MNKGVHKYRNLISTLDAALVIIDDREGVASSSGAAKDSELVRVVELMKAASAFAVPVIVTTIDTEEFAGQVSELLLDLVRGSEVIQRSAANPWDDDAFRNKIHTVDRSRLVIAGRCTEVSVTFAVLSALEEGFDVYIVKDATAGTSQQHHETAIERMVQAGAVPVTTRQIIFEWQRDLGSEPGSQGSPPGKKSRQKKP
ncbi:isochorismatase family protein [Thalassospira profundimaris]|uniref:isochorismatase family protein n=1 Tax=Thalassospira profundimaris TaxID=502049 RepID=UPI000DEDC2F9|nr:isochorismatase family protein [Thalassospira profundimaris]